jgi:hypothetical protein
MMIIIYIRRLEHKGYARLLGKVVATTASNMQSAAPGKPMRRFQLPLLGSNQDSPDPEGRL